MSDEFICWNCNQALINVILPMSRREECDKCKADQHVCNMCLYYVKGRCEEERAEHISNTNGLTFVIISNPVMQCIKQLINKNQIRQKLCLLSCLVIPLLNKHPQMKILSPGELAEKKCTRNARRLTSISR